MAVAAAVLPACADSFVPLGTPVEGQPEAGAAVWFKYDDGASTLFLRGTEARDSAWGIVEGRLRADIITLDEAILALNALTLSWLRLRIEVLKGPNGPVYAAELERMAKEAHPDSWSKRRSEEYSVPHLIARDEWDKENLIEDLTRWPWRPEGAEEVISCKLPLPDAR